MRSNLMTQLQLHRSGRTSLVRLWIRDYRLVVLFMIEICTMFVCYVCIDYFSRSACAFTHIACFHEPIDIQMVLQILWFQFVIIIIGVSNLTVDGNRLYLEHLQIHLYQTVDLFACYTLFIKLIGSMLYTGYINLANEVSLYYLYLGVLYLFYLD